MRSLLVISFTILFHFTFGCQPDKTSTTKPPKWTTPTRRTTVTTPVTPVNTLEERCFTMEVLPPVGWTYPTPGKKQHPQQAGDSENATESVTNSIQKEIDQFVKTYKLGPISVDDIEGAPIQADVVTKFIGQCSAETESSVILGDNDQTIRERCDTRKGIIAMEPIKVSGKFIFSSTVGKALNESMWSKLAIELQTLLEIEFVVFPTGNRILIEDCKNGVTTTDTPTPGDKSRATFSMSILPPVAWSYSSDPKYFKESLQKLTKADAFQRMKADIENSGKDVLRSHMIPESLITVTLDDVSITADVVEKTIQGFCAAVSPTSVVLSSDSKTIEKKCDTWNGLMDFEPVYLSGKFESSVPASNDMWQVLAQDLQVLLETNNYAVFLEDKPLQIKPY